ncbi:MAG: outer membrane beta-barrel family protein [Alistipes sp.]
MRKFGLLFYVIFFCIKSLSAAQQLPASGRVVDQQGDAVEYATVVLLKNDAQVAGIATDNTGHFSLRVAAGDYTLSIQYLGYEPLRQPLKVDSSQTLGTFVLKHTDTQIEGVVVKAQLIRRQADRFIVDVANSPVAIGKDGIEMLQHAPGVWITDDKISINGKSGTKIYVNDRELKMEIAQLLTYLRTLRAEDIQKIEVIPTSGADYDADSAGGILKITLKKQLDEGINGSLSFKTALGEYVHAYNPNAQINYHVGKLDLSASAWGYLGGGKALADETTAYHTSDAQLQSSSAMRDHYRNGGGTIGAIYELNQQHSLGAELSYMHSNEFGVTNSQTDFSTTNSVSQYHPSTLCNNYEVSLNYIYKIDTLGSTLKFLAGYTHRGNNNGNDNFSRTTQPDNIVDSTYRDHTISRYNIFTATLALDKKFSNKWSFKAGLKYTNNDMRNTARYEFQRDAAWVENQQHSYRIDYREHIGAAYGIVSATLGRWSVVGGLRAEYTYATGSSNYVKQNYVSLFPNANISYNLTRDGSYSLVAQYARTISRPWFWALTPSRMQISDYTYQVGNPQLTPAFNNELSLTLVMKYKYTLTAGTNIQRNEIQQTMRPESTNPDVLVITWENFDTTRNYYLAANLPFQVTKWLTFNANATYVYQGTRIEKGSALRYYHMLQGNLSTTITLPAKLFIDISYGFSNQLHFGNCWVEPQHRLEASIKKRFCGDRFTASFTVGNLLDQGQIIGAASTDFVRKVSMRQNWSNRCYKIGISYNFKSGKAFKNKSIENASAEDKNRL